SGREAGRTRQAEPEPAARRGAPRATWRAAGRPAPAIHVRDALALVDRQIRVIRAAGPRDVGAADLREIGAGAALLEARDGLFAPHLVLAHAADRADAEEDRDEQQEAPHPMRAGPRRPPRWSCPQRAHGPRGHRRMDPSTAERPESC